MTDRRTRTPMKLFPALLLALTLGHAAAAAAETTLRIGLQDDPDLLDPDKARSYTGRIVFAAMCDKLVDTTPELKVIPQLATSWSWSDGDKTLTFKLRPNVAFQDGEAFDAAAAKASLDRARSLPDSLRKSELASVESVEVVDPATVALHLKQPDATLLAQLTDRAGMMLAPKAAAGPDFASHPVCAGPYSFVRRVAQDRIELQKFPGYWNAGAYPIDRVVYLPIPDTTVRLANLRSGDIDMIERLSATDVPQVKAVPGLEVISVPGLGYNNILFNVGNGARAKTPFGTDARVRRAFELAIDRDAINQVVFSGLYAPDNQPFPPNGPWYDHALPIKPRDVDAAKALLKQAGVPTPVPVELLVDNSTNAQAVAQIVQAMANEAGFNVTLRVTEFATLLSEQVQGNYQASMINWSGRIDPDGNIDQFVTCHGSINETKYCNPDVDKLLDQARTVSDPAARKALYDQAQAILLADLPQLYLYAEPRLFAITRKLHGFVPHPDGLIRLQGVSLQP